jgi:4-diphosphocytidyl-2-C-methyl-D-erythritol kinase
LARARRSRAGLVERAPAKVNLTLAVLGRRPDGYHTLDSLVAFAQVGDRLRLEPDKPLGLAVRGANAAQAGVLDDNLVLRAARALSSEVPGLGLGRFTLDKCLPVAAGLGGGSADAGAALRLLARLNRIALDDPRLRRAPRQVGADVPVCLDPRTRRMRGIGEKLSKPLAMPALPAVLVNPGVALATKDVFAALERIPGGPQKRALGARALPHGRGKLMDVLARGGNDLEPPAMVLAPAVARALAALRRQPGCVLARMSGSGATCFGLFTSSRAAAAAARRLAAGHRRWWVKATVLG